MDVETSRLSYSKWENEQSEHPELSYITQPNVTDVSPFVGGYVVSLQQFI